MSNGQAGPLTHCRSLNHQGVTLRTKRIAQPQRLDELGSNAGLLLDIWSNEYAIGYE
jgi:hypothetical protein